MSTGADPNLPSGGGIVDRIKGYVAKAIGTTRTRVDAFSADVEHRVLRLVGMIIWTLVAFICLSLGLLFAVLTIMFGFDLPPKYVFGIPAIIFLATGLLGLVMFKRKKSSKPPSRQG